MVQQQAQTLYGLWADSGDRSIAKDIPTLSAKFYTAASRQPQSVLPFYVLTRDYDPASGRFRLFIGAEQACEGLEAFELPAGPYGVVTVRPKLGFMWGAAIGEAKRAFYAEWLPASPYGARNLEYERHSERSVGKKPRIELHFAVEDT